jgi:AcrR family transcriptional regulator
MESTRRPFTLSCVRQSSQGEVVDQEREREITRDRDDLDPRVARSRAAVISAATELLVEAGPSAVTIDAIVARSGVAKSTIYRHWVSRDEVLLDVMEVCAPDLVDPDPALGVEGGLREIAHRIAEMLNDPEWARVLPALLMLKTHAHGIADLDKRMEERQNEVVRTLIRRGVDEGLLTPAAEDDEASAVLVGPLFFAQLTGLVAIDAGFVERTVDRFLAAYRPA